MRQKMNEFQPKVSIIIPVYNGANYMRQSINSALAQTYKNIEVIVVNDGSNDHGATDEIAASYGRLIRYFVKENGGVASALNYAIDKMTGDYFSWLSHDDMYAPEKVEKQVDALAELGDPLAVCACNVIVIDENDQKLKSNRMASRASRSIRCFLATDTETGLNGCALLVPKELINKCGGFDPRLKTTQDYDLWFRFTYHSRFLLLEDELVMSRSHQQQTGRSMGMLPTIESDNLHAMMLSKIDMAELREFLGDDLEYLLSAYKTYQNAAYWKTSARLYAAAIQFATELGDPDRAASLFSERLLPVEKSAQKKARRILDTLASLSSQSERPTILIYSNVWFKGGIERVMSFLFAHLSHEYNFILISHASSENFDGFPLPEGLCHIVIRQDLQPEIPYVLLMLAVLSQASLVISNPNIFADVLKIYPVMKESGIKTIACNHYYYFLPTWAPWLYPVMTERLSCLKDATVVTWLNTFNANAYALHNRNGVVMPNPNTFDLCDEGLTHSSEKIVLCVGRFYDSIKRLDRMIKVFKLVLDKKPDAHLVLVGGYNLNLKIPPSSPETIADLLERLEFPDGSIVFAGEQDELTDFYQKASVLAMPSESEGFSLVLTEAGAYGVPSVLFEIPGLDDIITDGKNGFVVEQDDLKGMAERIVELLSNEELRESMGQSARELSSRFNRQAICDRWSKLIRMVLNSEDTLEFEKQLSEYFTTPPQDKWQFAQTIAREYEKGVRTIIQERASNSVVVERIAATSTLTPDLTQKEIRLVTILRRIRNVPFFHFVYVDLVKPIFRAIRKVRRWIK